MNLPLRLCRLGTIGSLLVTVVCADAVSMLKYATYLPYVASIGGVNGVPIRVRSTADHDGNTFIGFTRTNITNVQGTSFTFDGFVAKISVDGKSIAFTTYLNSLIVTALALDDAGNVYVAGAAFGPFAPTPNAFQKDAGPGIVAKLGPDGSVLYASYLSATPFAIAADTAGAAYLAGTAGADFRTTSGAYKPDIGDAKCKGQTGAAVPCTDAFVVKVSSDGSRVLYATLVGGTANDSAAAITVDSSGSAYIAGSTSSADFPTTPGAFQTSFGGGATDGFAARLDPAGHMLVYATFMGGSSADSATGIALNANQNAYLVGTTASADFPVSPGAYQPVFGGGSSASGLQPSGDAFFLKLTSGGAAVYASYLGGPGDDRGVGIALGPANRLYLAIYDALNGQENGSLIGNLERRPMSPCEPALLIAAIDRDTGQWIDSYAGTDIGATDISVDGSGIVHAIGLVIRAYDSFELTSDAMFGIGVVWSGAGSPMLARIDFTRKQQLVPRCIVNAASNQLGVYYSIAPTLAPGEIVSIYGLGLGPAAGVTVSPDSTGVYPRDVGDTRIRAGDTLLPLLYVSESQVNAIVPYSLASAILGGYSTYSTLTVEHDSFQASYPIQIFSEFPGIFVQPESGGQAAVLNQDGSINAPANPAAPGSIISIFATGMGRLDPSIADDAVTLPMPPWPGIVDHFLAEIGPGPQVNMEIQYAGPAPGLIPGVYQINARVPDTVGAGQIPIQFIFQPSSDASQYSTYVSIASPKPGPQAARSR